ncbi:DUF2065 domain-containing protein [Azospirillum halopraeferens]|uniref:DUF2065 domain-containing protein n=1 Tax=Azospirillum halopraeferens TaxID=34010 RepID=UPI000418D0D5|nr:DUF2065 domain-containing protein [Azospirillum halopraeferens]
MDELWTALALILVIEGALYALFPGTMRRVIAEALILPEGSLRLGGLCAAAAGVAIVWLLRGA